MHKRRRFNDERKGKRKYIDRVRTYIRLTLSWCCGRLRAPWSRRPPSRSASASNPSIEDSASLSQAKNLSRDRSKLWREFIAECSSFPRLMMLGKRSGSLNVYQPDSSTKYGWYRGRDRPTWREIKVTRSDDEDFATYDSIPFYQALQSIKEIKR